MNVRGRIWLLLRLAAGLSSAFVTLHGLYGIYGLDFRRDTMVSTLYCIFPILSFFIFLFVKAPKLELSLHLVIAIGYLTTFSMLNWRTCAEMGYCNVRRIHGARNYLNETDAAAFAVVLCALLAILVGSRPRKLPYRPRERVVAE